MIGDRVWKRAIDFFAEQEVYIEASNLVLRLWIEDEKTLAKDYGLGKGKIGEWAKPYKGDKAYELEKATGVVVDYLMKEINAELGIVTSHKVSVLERIKGARR